MIDLHLHLDGSLTPDDIIELAKIQNYTLPTLDKVELRKALSFSGERTLKNYLTYFDLPLCVLQSKETFIYQSNYDKCNNANTQKDAASSHNLVKRVFPRF